MNLYFFANNLTNPKTGGEIYNRALMEAALLENFNVIDEDLDPILNGKRNMIKGNIHVLKKFLKTKPDSILIFDFGLIQWFFLALLIAPFFKSKKIIGMLHHYSYWDSFGLKGKTLHYLAAHMLSSKVNIIFTNSKFNKNEYKKITKKNIPIFIIPPFVSNKPCCKNPKKHPTKPIFLHVGTIQERKNIHTAIKALSMTNLDFQFNIVGKWESELYKVKLLKIVNELNLADKVFFHGRLNNDELDKKLSEASIFLLVSTIEGYGMAYTEAMRYGLPIIASNKGAIPEVVKNLENGILCEPFNVTEITNAINKICKNEDLYKKISNANLKKYQILINRKFFIKKYQKILKHLTTNYNEFYHIYK